MNTTRNQKAIAIGAAVAAITAGGALLGAGSAAAPSAGGRTAAPVLHGWPTATDHSAREALRDLRSAAREDGGSVLTLIEVTRRFELVDVGEAGDSPGDSIIFESGLFTRGGDRVGQDSAHCMSGIRTFVCDATFRVTGRGKITVAGAFFGREPQLAITGGTREFREAGG